MLACGYGLVPNLELPRLLGCETTPERVRTDDAQRTSRADVFAAGEACGIGGLGQALATGAVAGLGRGRRRSPDRAPARVPPRAGLRLRGWHGPSRRAASCAPSRARTRSSAAART